MDLVVLPGSAWAAQVAADFASRLRSNPGLRVCLPTGSTPVPVYDAIADLADRGACSLALASVVLLDEWLGLPTGDPARCDTRIRGQLLDRLPTPPAAVHLVDVDHGDPADAAARHDAAGRGLDLAVLGLGMNGHVGFNEPGSVADSPTRVVELSQTSRDAARARYGASGTPSAGITLGMDRILAAGEVWLLVTGERKARVLARAVRDPESAECPASFLRRHPRLRVYADEDAAALL